MDLGFTSLRVSSTNRQAESLGRNGIKLLPLVSENWAVLQMVLQM